MRLSVCISVCLYVCMSQLIGTKKEKEECHVYQLTVFLTWYLNIFKEYYSEYYYTVPVRTNVRI